MKKSIARKIFAVTAFALLIFTAAMLIVTDSMNKEAARKNAVNLLKTVGAAIKSGALDDYKDAARYSDDGENIRITIIALDGTVLADTLPYAVGSLENHADRKEVKEALSGGVGSDVRRSDSSGSSYLYVAELTDTGTETVVLRIAVGVREINSYIFGIIAAAALILVLVLIAVGFISKPIADGLIKPFALIRERLDAAAADDGADKRNAPPITLTNYDEVNAALIDIDEISEKMKSGIKRSRDDKRKLDFIIENINQGVITLSKDGLIGLRNKTAAEFWGIPEGTKEPLCAYIRDKNFNKKLEEAAARGEAARFDMTEASGRVLEIRFRPTAESGISGIITAADVTDARKLSAEKQEFFESASHELNTPLSSILGYGETMLADGKFKREFLEIINKEATRMKILISDMLKISELERNAATDDAEIDIKDIAERAARSLMPKAAAKNITLKTSLCTGMIYADEEKITELISNLADNAIKYNNEGGAVEIASKKTDKKVVLTVKDNGIGIPQEYIPRVFERFFRVGKGRAKRESGTGLGLAIVKHIANRYNAALSIESTVGYGTTVTVAFPEYIKNPPE